MKIGITALGSGSRGNAFVVHAGDTGILIDAGFSCKALLEKMEATGINPGAIKAMLLTHEHDDHAKGCRVFCDKLKIPVCATYRTAKYLFEQKKLAEHVMEFMPGSIFSLEGFSINPFSVRHDAIEPVGFTLTRGDTKIGLATDLGSVDQLAQMRLRDCDILVLESNYDMEMLRNSQRSLHLKRRIMGRHGHLNNIDTLAALPDLLTERTRALYLVHISSECNDYDLVRKQAEKKLHEMGRGDILLNVVKQTSPTNTFYL